jgi:hypothetical protein
MKLSPDEFRLKTQQDFCHLEELERFLNEVEAFVSIRTVLYCAMVVFWKLTGNGDCYTQKLRLAAKLLESEADDFAQKTGRGP